MKVFRGMKSNDESGILAFTNVRNPCSQNQEMCHLCHIPSRRSRRKLARWSHCNMTMYSRPTDWAMTLDICRASWLNPTKLIFWNISRTPVWIVLRRNGILWVIPFHLCPWVEYVGIQILHTLQGLVYLHDQGFVHGDIRGVQLQFVNCISCEYSYKHRATSLSNTTIRHVSLTTD